jgi:hypothetical protein
MTVGESGHSQGFPFFQRLTYRGNKGEILPSFFRGYFWLSSFSHGVDKVLHPLCCATQLGKP